MPKRKPDSPAMKLILHVVEYEQRSRHSTTEGNHAIHAAILLAIRYGLKFDADDFARLSRPPSDGYGSSILDSAVGSEAEFLYAVACGRERGHANPSAAQAYEKWKGRKPFLLRASPRVKTPSRVYERHEFVWHGVKVTCTSFNDAAAALTAVSYMERVNAPTCAACGGTDWRNQDYSIKVAKRYTITHDDIRDYHASLKNQATL